MAALDGILVVDLSRALAGPHAGQMLADLGARVIKVEAPQKGDDTRSWGPPFVEGHDGKEYSTYFLSCNRGKESIALNLKDEKDKEILRKLLAKADVVIENFRFGVMQRLGFGPETLAELNPRLVQLTITGFGHDGPESSRAGYDQILQGEAGLMSITGADPDNLQRVGVPIADLLGGIHGVVGVLSALYEREITGKGQVVRTSLLASLVGVHAFQGTSVTVAGKTPKAQGNHHPSIAPYGLFKCKDGAVQISVGSDKLWQVFSSEFAIDSSLEELATNAKRVENRQLVISVVEDKFAEYNADELLIKLKAAGIPAGKVRDLQEVYQWPQLHSQNLLATVNHSMLGEINLPGAPLRFFDVDSQGETETTKTKFQAPPVLDEHGAAIRQWLSDEE